MATCLTSRLTDLETVEAASSAGAGHWAADSGQTGDQTSEEQLVESVQRCASEDQQRPCEGGRW